MLETNQSKQNIVCITSKNSVGCSFFDWSINFLAGNTDFFNVTEAQRIPLSTNPVNFYNSHGHKKNHPSGMVNTVNYVREFQNQDAGLYTMYPCPLNIDDVCNVLKIDHNQLSDPEVFRRIWRYQDNDYINMINFCIGESVPVIYVHYNFQSIGYSWNRRSLDRQLLKPNSYENDDHAQNDFHRIFCNQSIRLWHELGLDNRWDIRERMALDIRPFDSITSTEIPITSQHLWVDCQDLWHNTDLVLIDAMKFINVPIDIQQWNQWLPVMRNWQEIQRKQLRFYYVVDHIVNSIVNNWYYPLDSLSLFQEAIIQHCLIYKHNLNLKTWNLDSFPSNTQDLHKLLEPNLHNVPVLY